MDFGDINGNAEMVHETKGKMADEQMKVRSAYILDTADLSGKAEMVHKLFKGKIGTYGQTKVDWHEAVGHRTEGDERHKAGGTVERIDFYNDNADSYAADQLALGYTGPAKAAEIVHQYFKDATDACILDVGCGDGLVMENLSKMATYTNMHGLDPSSKLLERAQKSGHYSKLIEKYFTPDTGLPHNTYDGLVCCGAFIPGHLRSECVTEMINLVKPGGYVLIVMREVLIHVDEDFKNLKPIIKRLADQKKITIAEDYKYNKFYMDFQGQVWILRKN